MAWQYAYQQQTQAFQVNRLNVKGEGDMATLASSSRNSIGDLTLYSFYFSTIATTDSYNVTNLPGVIGAVMSPWSGANTLNNMCLTYTNSTTGCTLSFIGASASSARVYVFGQG